MSLYEISIINVLSLINTGYFSLGQLQDQYKLPVDLLKSIKEYVALGPGRSFIISISNNQFQLANYFYSSIKTDDEIFNVLMDAMEKQVYIYNLNGIEYILSKVIIDNVHKSLLNWGLAVSARTGNRFLVNLFIEKGAIDMNSGLNEATKGNHIDLIKLFLEKGAYVRDSTIEFSVESGNESMLNLLLGIPRPSELGIGPLVTALYHGFSQFIDILMPVRYDQSETVKLGPRLLLLFKNTLLMSKSGINYGDLFPLLQQGYAKKHLIYKLFGLYMAEKDVYFDPLLISILGKPIYTEPAYMRHRRLGRVNPKDPKYRHYFTLMQLEQYEQELELFTNIPPELIDYFSTPDVIAQLVKEDKIMEALYLTYSTHEKNTGY